MVIGNSRFSIPEQLNEDKLLGSIGIYDDEFR